MHYRNSLSNLCEYFCCSYPKTTEYRLMAKQFVQAYPHICEESTIDSMVSNIFT